MFSRLEEYLAPLFSFIQPIMIIIWRGRRKHRRIVIIIISNHLHVTGVFADSDLYWLLPSGLS